MTNCDQEPNPVTRGPQLAGRSDGTAERALMRAVLGDAVLCLLYGDRNAKRAALAREARRWIQSPDRQWPFSFENVCAALGIESTWFRRRLLAHCADAVSASPAKLPEWAERMAEAFRAGRRRGNPRPLRPPAVRRRNTTVAPAPDVGTAAVPAPPDGGTAAA